MLWSCSHDTALFSDIRDYMLQQARQRADVGVGDVCHPTEKLVQSHHEWAQTRALPLPQEPQLGSQWICLR